ncbi:MAG: regulatory protein RecX [Flavobacteriales bacterium]|nr:regulatory protein RecX [Flavobacteriales bacterium]
MYQNKQALSYSEVLSKAMRYCSYQERSIYEVKQKLREYRLKESDLQLILEYLQKENFLNEIRFADAFVRGKVNIKRWGLFKIREGLSAKGVSSKLVNEAVKGIDEKVYLQNLEELVEKKLNLLGTDEQKREKLYRFLQSKGYESDLIMKEMKRISLV